MAASNTLTRLIQIRRSRICGRLIAIICRHSSPRVKNRDFSVDRLTMTKWRADGRIKYAYAVNPDPEESDLRPVDRDHLPAQLAASEKSGFLGGQADYDE